MWNICTLLWLFSIVLLPQTADTQGDGGSGVVCSNGQYLDSNNVCQTCPGGFYCVGNNRYGCAASTYCPSGCSSPIDCGPGTLCPAGSSSPTQCPAGSYCPSSTSQIQCPAGNYCPAGSSSPTSCSAGSYCPAGSSRPTQCPAGFYCSSTASLTQCPAGSYCPAGSTSAIACPPGTVCPIAGLSSTQTCPAGSYCPNMGMTAGSTCTAGNYCPAGSASQATCTVGNYCPNNGMSAPSQCPAGSYCPNTGMTAGITCTAGNYCPTGSRNQVTCTVGNYCPNNGMSAPTACPAGSYCPSGGMQTATRCAAAYYCPNTGSSSMSACPAGSICPSTGMITPTSCPAGSYCPNTLMTSGTVCPTGYYCPNTGMTSPATCPAGYYCPTTGLTAAPGCSAGNYCPSGSSAQQACQVGYYCPSNFMSGPYTCGAGYYCSTTRMTSRTICPAGSYCVGPTNGAPTTCPAGSYCPSTGMSGPTTCPAGNFCPTTGLTGFTTCPVASYCPVGSVNPTTCTVSNYCPSTGMAVPTACLAGYFCPTTGLSTYTANPCPVGSYCPTGSSGPVTCPAGSYCATTQLTTPVACPIRYYCPNSGMSTYTGYPCPAGSYCPTTGMSTPTPCPAAYYCPNTLMQNYSSFPCPISFICPNTGMNTYTNTPCPAGSYCPTTAMRTGLLCPAGYLCAVTGISNYSSYRCPIGSYCPTSGMTVAATCPAGSYCPALGMTAPTACPISYYCPITGLSAFTNYPCPAGNICPSTGMSTPTPCSPGTYCPSQRMTVSTPCLVSTYCPNSGMITPFSCPQGQLCPSAGMSASIPCPIGSYCPRLNMTVGVPCPQGYYCPVQGISNHSLYPCPKGYYCPNLSMNTYTANPCPRGYYCPNLAMVTYASYPCPVSYICPTTGMNNFTSTPCPIGNYCPFTNMTSGILCPVSYVCPSTGMATYVSSPCPIGYICPSLGMSVATPCPAGRYCPASGLSAGVLCPIGAYCPNTTMISPAACPRGNYCPLLNMTAPFTCLVGSHCPNTSMTAGTLCPLGHYCPVTGIVDFRSYPCPIGYVCPVEGMRTYLNTPCPQGYYCPAQRMTTNTTYSCPSGYYCPLLGLTTNNSFPCPPGFACGTTAMSSYVNSMCNIGGTCPQTGGVNAINCGQGAICAVSGAADPVGSPCRPGTLCPTNQNRPKACGTGTLCPFDAASSDMPCLAGMYCPWNSSTTQALCPKGSYCPVPALQSPLACPSGTYCPARGLRAPKVCPAGWYCSLPNQTEPNSKCPGGTFCPRGSPATAITCPKGSYCPTGAIDWESFPCGSATLCSAGVDEQLKYPCPSGFYCPVNGSIAALPCPIGHSCPGGSSAPQSCPLHAFAAASGASVCKTCAPGTYTEGEGSSYCLQCREGVAAAPCVGSKATWRQVLTVVSGKLNVTNLRGIFLLHPSGEKAICNIVARRSNTTATCTIDIVPGIFEKDASQPAALWGYGGGSLYRVLPLGSWEAWKLGVDVQLHFSQLHVRPTELMRPFDSSQWLTLHLSYAQLTQGDWSSGGITAPISAGNVRVWLRDAPCRFAAFMSDSQVTCLMPGMDEQSTMVTVEYSGILNMTAQLAPLTISPAIFLHQSQPLNILAPNPAYRRWATGLTDISIPGSMCTNDTTRVQTVSIGGVPCSGILCQPLDQNATALLCRGWNATRAMQPYLGAPSALLSVIATWKSPEDVRCVSCIQVHARPVLMKAVPSIIPGAGATLILAATALSGGVADNYVPLAASSELPKVYIDAGTESFQCGNVTYVPSGEGAVKCVTPTIPERVKGYPVLRLRIVNPVGAESIDEVLLTYPAVFSVRWIYDSTVYYALPSDATIGSSLSLHTAPMISVQSRDSATCRINVNTSAQICLKPSSASAYVPSKLLVSQAPAATAAASSLVEGSTNYYTLIGISISGPGGCAVPFYISCVDTTGRIASTDVSVNALHRVQLPQLDIGWLNANETMYWTPSAVQVPSIHFGFSMLWMLEHPLHPLKLEESPYVSCTALLLAPAAAVPFRKPFSKVPLEAFISTVTSSVISGNHSSLELHFPPLDASAAVLGSMYTIAAECIWRPTGERFRLPDIKVIMTSLQVSWMFPNSSGITISPDNRIQVVGFTPYEIGVRIDYQPEFTPYEIPDIVCNLEQTVSEMAVGTRLVSSPVRLRPQKTTGLQSGTSKGLMMMALEAPENTTVGVRIVCSWFEQSTPSAELMVGTDSLQVLPVSTLPRRFIPSDVSSPSRVQPAVEIIAISVSGAQPLKDVLCSLDSTTAGVQLFSVAVGTTLRNRPADATTGIVRFPLFVVQTASFEITQVTVNAFCIRPSGESLPVLSWTMSSTPLKSDICQWPDATADSGVELHPFSVGIAVAREDGGWDQPCSGSAGDISDTQLPPITCEVAFNETQQGALPSDVLILRNGAVDLGLDGLHTTVFQRLTLIVPHGRMYTLHLQCYLGSLRIPPRHQFSVLVAGCAPGFSSVGVSCAPCPGNSFSFGGPDARCIDCPRTGASCSEGILKLLPHYFRPSREAADPIGPQTELHSCFNAEACVLNQSSLYYGCREGYVGPLCGVCDADAGYARFGNACQKCWNPALSVLFVGLLVGLLVAVLAKMALQKESKRSDLSIVLRIIMGYLQATGALRAFVVGGTLAYHEIMGWTDVVTASPFSVGALQCLAGASYLTQFLSVLLLPLLASGTLVFIVVLSTTYATTSCKAGLRLDGSRWLRMIHNWWAMGRQWSLMLVVMSLAYMPIISNCLRALDCYDRPIAGTVYLRRDLRVQCYVGEHALARVLAFFVLVIFGMGFPVAIALLLGRARREHILDDTFRGRWGFLFMGYRGPSESQQESGRRLVSPEAKATHPVPTLQQIVQGCKPTPGSLLWWESVVLVRKAGVVLLSLLVTNPYAQCSGAALWFLGFLLLQLRYHPYERVLFNVLEMVVLGCNLLTAMVSTMLLEYNVGVAIADLHNAENMRPVEWLVTASLVALNLAVFICLITVCIYIIWSENRQKGTNPLWALMPCVRGPSDRTARPSEAALTGAPAKNGSRRASDIMIFRNPISTVAQTLRKPT